MNMDCYEKATALNELYARVLQAEEDVKAGRVSDPYNTLNELRSRYAL